MPLSNRIKLILLFTRVNMYVIELILRNKHFPPKSRMALNLSDMKATTRDKSVKTLLSNGPFLHSEHTYPLSLFTPTPSPKINVVF